MVSTPVLNMLRIQGYGFFYLSCISEEDIHLVWYIFVDDTDIVQSDPEEQNPMATAVRMQGSLDTWDGGIGAIGGASEPESFWYMLSFVWEHGCWRYATIDETPANVSVLDATGIRVTLERLEAHESRKTLGVETAPDGNSDREFQIMCKLTEGWRDKKRASHLQKMDAWQALNTKIWNSL
jgi:hypothetical protein